MAAPRESGRGIFGLVAPTRERTTTPVLPRPEVRPTPAPEGKPPKTRKQRHTVRNIALGATALGVLGAGAYETVPAIHRAVDSAFLDHLRGKSLSSEASIAETVFDNNATKGVITDKNTVQITREEYAKIAPPVIDRTNVKQVPAEIKLTGGGVRKLTFERGTSINTMIYVKTANGRIADITYTKVTSPGGKAGVGFFGVSFPGCEYLVGEKNEIQAGYIFPAPISGYVYYSGSETKYYRGEKLEEGSSTNSSYIIEGDYVDTEGKRVKVTAFVQTLGYSGSAITKALVPGIPNSSDFSEGDSRTTGSFINTEKLNKARVKVNQGDDLFKFITVPPYQEFIFNSRKKSQVDVYLKYETDFGENGIADTFGGADCTHPTLDNKAIVLK